MRIDDTYKLRTKGDSYWGNCPRNPSRIINDYMQQITATAAAAV